MLAAIGPGRYRATRAATSSKLVGASERSVGRMAVALELEHADRLGPAQHLEGRARRRAATSSMSGRVPVVRSIRSRARSITDRLRSPRKSILRRPSSSTPCISYWVTIGASSGVDAGVGLALDRQVLGERVVGDDHGGGVDAVLAAQALEALGHVDDLVRLGVRLVHRPQLGGCGVAVLVPGHLVEAGRERGVAAHDQRRHRLGDLVADDVGEAEHPRRVAHRGPGLDRREGDDLGDVVASRSARPRSGSSRPGSARRSPCRCRASACGRG